MIDPFNHKIEQLLADPVVVGELDETAVREAGGEEPLYSHDEVLANPARFGLHFLLNR